VGFLREGKRICVLLADAAQCIQAFKIKFVLLLVEPSKRLEFVGLRSGLHSFPNFVEEV